MKSPAGTVLRLAGKASPAELKASDPIQELINRHFWADHITDTEVSVVLCSLAVQSSVVDLTLDDLLEWQIGYMRRTVTFGSKLRLKAGDVVLFNNLDAEGHVMASMHVWAPRLVHVGVVDEDAIDPL